MTRHKPTESRTLWGDGETASGVAGSCGPRINNADATPEGDAGTCWIGLPRAWSYWLTAVTPRRFCDQQDSLESVQIGRSLP